ncbi:MAG: T9SS type A sorting domain-containing protein [Bacteroidia bacterium]|nr:T9SS type A sorting domain-containing protein [Bacteroidia bacterium]
MLKVTLCLALLLAGASQRCLPTHALPPVVEIFPNPTHHSLFVKVDLLKSQNGSISLETREGQKLFTKPLPKEENPVSLHLDISIFPPGIYILKVSSDAGEITKRFLKL